MYALPLHHYIIGVLTSVEMDIFKVPLFDKNYYVMQVL